MKALQDCTGMSSAEIASFQRVFFFNFSHILRNIYIFLITIHVYKKVVRQLEKGAKNKGKHKLLVSFAN